MTLLHAQVQDGRAVPVDDDEVLKPPGPIDPAHQWPLTVAVVGRIVRGEAYPDLTTLARQVALRTNLLARGLFCGALAEPERDA
ncbi:hypothetical protein [Streptomyces huasconensis]|uniref:hypothetical protein n=1 Tax=Streptomyces huasconensis TaxID=1854574 RepID=UPI0036FC98DA